jgi:hypothetical protein
MQVEILLQGTKFICRICGFMSSDKNEILVHEADRPNLEEPDIFLGQEVEIYRTTYTDGGRPIGVSDTREKFVVKGLWYSQGQENLPVSRPARQHQLCVELASRDYPGSSLLMTYHDFLLWRGGNLEKLEQVGLIRPAPAKLSLGQKFFKLIGA